MDTRGKTTAITTLLMTALVAGPGLTEQQRADVEHQGPGRYQDYIDAVRAQRQAQLAERRRAMQEAAENRRQLGEARRRAFNDLSRQHTPPLPPTADEQQGQRPGSAIPPYWDNAWYYRGY